MTDAEGPPATVESTGGENDEHAEAGRLAAEEAARAKAEGRMTLWEHLVELRDRLIRSAAAVACGAILCWIFYPQIFDFLLHPYCSSVLERGGDLLGPNGEPVGCQLFVRDPLEGFSTRLKVSVYGGIVLAMPVLLWQLWRFIAPGLYDHEKRYAIPFVGSALTLFLLGAGMAYWTLPRALTFLGSIGGPDLQEFYSPVPYLNLVTYMMLAFGVGFEFPILLIFLQLAGIVTTAQLRSGRRYAIVGIVILVALITPSGDPISLMALTVPMWFFYEMAILIGMMLKGRGLRPAS